MNNQLKDCMNFIHIRTKKECDYQGNGFRVNICSVTGINLTWDKEIGIHKEVNCCNYYKHYNA